MASGVDLEVPDGLNRGRIRMHLSSAIGVICLFAILYGMILIRFGFGG